MSNHSQTPLPLDSLYTTPCSLPEPHGTSSGRASLHLIKPFRPPTEKSSTPSPSAPSVCGVTWSAEDLRLAQEKLAYLSRVLPAHAVVVSLVVDNLICDHWVQELNKTGGA